MDRLVNILIRVDSSLEIGTGHVMRCLTLAKALRDAGANISFISRAHQGNIVDQVKSQGFKVYLLPQPTSKISSASEKYLQHSDWLGSTQELDAENCKHALGETHFDWIIVDHYGIDRTWESLMSSHSQNIFVIDDLADRKHNCSILLDQNFGRKVEDYQDLVSESCQKLIGLDFTLLRSEFLNFRKQSIAFREDFDPYVHKRLLVSLGGVDKDNVTLDVLRQIECSEKLKSYQIVVVLGQANPHYNTISAFIQERGLNVELHIGVSNVAEILSGIDIAIGAAGSSAWERCCLGIPMLNIILAENQRVIANNLAQYGIAEKMEIHDLHHMDKKLNNLLDNYESYSRRCLALVSGDGVYSVVRKIIKPTISLKKVDSNALEFLFELQCIPEIRHFSRNPNPPSLKEHKRWFESRLSSSDPFYLIMYGDLRCGFLRLDKMHDIDNRFEISLAILPKFQGLGIASVALENLLKLHDRLNFYAYINPENTSSCRLFQRKGFSQKSLTEYYLDKTNEN